MRAFFNDVGGRLGGSFGTVCLANEQAASLNPFVSILFFICFFCATRLPIGRLFFGSSGTNLLTQLLAPYWNCVTESCLIVSVTNFFFCFRRSSHPSPPRYPLYEKHFHSIRFLAQILRFIYFSSLSIIS